MKSESTPQPGTNKDPKRFTWSTTFKQRQQQGKQVPAGSSGGGK